MPRLKVFALDVDGLHDWAVAAPNQRAALDALGMNQNLFAHGQARVADDPAAIEAALARPGEPVRRLRGSAAAFAPAGGADKGWEAALKAAPKASRAKPGKAEAARRARIEKAAGALEALDADRRLAEEALDDERRALEDRAAKTAAGFEKQRRRLEEALRKAKSAKS